jgi:hypothetical protein
MSLCDKLLWEERKHHVLINLFWICRHISVFYSFGILDSSVGVMTRPRTSCLMNLVSIPGRGNIIFSSPRTSRPALVPTWAFSPRIIRTKREVYDSFPSNAEFKNEWSSTSLPSMLSWLKEKLKLNIEHATKVQRWSRCINLLFL